MNTQSFQPLRLHLPLLAGGVAAILVSGIAIASLALSARVPSGDIAPAGSTSAAAAPVVPAPGPSALAYRCNECGVIESTRTIESLDEWAGVSAPGRNAAGSRGKVETPPPRNYEITIRLRDGSKRVVTDTNPARWRQGERVTVIAGVNQ
jgi:hypothetical protein